ARAFRAVGPLGFPTRALHDRIAAGVYQSIRRGLVALAPMARALGAPPGTGEGARARTARSLASALIGAELEHAASTVALPMTLRAAGTDRTRAPRDLVAALAAPSSRLVVFLHGLGETDTAWLPRPGSTPAQAVCFADLLATELATTSLFLQYNSGLAVRENGRRLAALLEELLARWPGPASLGLVGHSMGGLVAQAAGEAALARGQAWVSRLRAVVCLGSPHLGSPVAKAAAAASWALDKVPEGRPIARILEARSPGIRDLTAGYQPPLLPGVTYRFLYATVTREVRHPVGALVGDWLVRPSSGSRRLPEPTAVHVPAAHHFDLLTRPDVYAQLRPALDALVTVEHCPAPG
ncbi:MAG: alpha/beta fold hydrolase, partial [Mycobacteriales bacterium]